MFVQLNPLVNKPINMPALCVCVCVCVFVYGMIVGEELIWSQDEE